MRYGYFLSTEEYTPAELIDQAVRAEAAGFDGLCISDHFHPWNNAQGQSAFVWSVIGAISHACSLPVLTAVTCPTVRLHPVIVAQAAATSAVLLEDRFILGVGTGEALNEHITGEAWPHAEVRLEMLEEAVDIIRRLFTGEVVSHRGRHYTVDTARLYTLPSSPPPIYVSAFGPKAIDLASRIGDGFVTTQPDEDGVAAFKAGDRERPAVAAMKVAYAATRDEGVDHAHRLWSNAGVPGELAQVLPSPEHFEQASTLVTREATSASVPAGPDLQEHVKAFAPFADAGFDTVYVANMGPRYQEMLEFYGAEVLPALRDDNHG